MTESDLHANMTRIDHTYNYYNYTQIVTAVLLI